MAIVRLIPEDLEFLMEQSTTDYIDECVEVEALSAAGLMWHSEINADDEKSDGKQRYSFTQLGETVYNYACRLDDVNQNPSLHFMPVSRRLANLNIPIISDEYTDKLFKENTNE